MSTTEQIGQTSVPMIVVDPSHGWIPLKLRELWEYRWLMVFLAKRDIAVRYKQTILGGAWAMFQPLITMIVFSIVFGRLAKIPSDGVPYPIFSFAALLPWQYFAAALTNASNSLVGSSNMIAKVYFPRLVIPIASILPAAVDFLLSFSLLLIMIFYFKLPLTFNILWLPLFLLLTVITALGAGLWLSAVNVRYRDVQHVVPFLVQVGMFVSPVAYSTHAVPERWRAIYGLNPVAGSIEGFRWALLGTNFVPGRMLVVSVITAVAILVSGAFYFRRMEKTFADVV